MAALTGRMSLDLLHPAGAQDPARWLGAVTGLDSITTTAADIAPVHALRDSVRRTAARAAAGAPASIVDRLALNAAAAVTPPRPVLRPDGRRSVDRPVPVPEVLSLLARDAIDLFGGPLAARIRMCAGCGLPYVAWPARHC
ncbi:ABATE domain-containing protein [Dactylosporangium sp. NPDC005555]|uniref:ABATE domain-containing protein n=1 Tax=Dactylosporangium sp. NPDC005555 TaxID=3154889 RepID=UPI0033B83877